MELSVEVAVEGLAFGTHLCPAVAVAVHIDVGRQLSIGIQMLSSIMAPPEELCGSADFEPAIHGSYEVFLQAAADGAEAFAEFVVRYIAATGRIVSISDAGADRLTVAAVLCRNSIDECAFLLDRHGHRVFANLLVEAFYASLVAVQGVCQGTVLDVVEVLDEGSLCFVLVAIAVGDIDVLAGDVTGVT